VTTERRSGRVGKAGPLNRARILAAAQRLVERDGVDRLTMRGVAEEIGTSPMSLYRHVADKRSLLIGLLEDLAAQVSRQPLPAGPDPAQRVVDTAVQAYDVLAANPWSVQAVLSVAELPPTALPISEHVFAALREAGLDDETAILAHSAMWRFVWGQLMFGHFDDLTLVAYRRRQGPEEYAELAKLAASAPTATPRDAFLAGLTALVHGFLRPA
jgi:AcrR family transcriptional regulator